MSTADPSPRRHLVRWLTVVAAGYLVVRVATGLFADREPGAAEERVRWQPIAGAEARARAAGKPVLYYFTADWCAPCRVMQREVFADAAIARRLERAFVPVKVVDRQREDGRNLPAVDSLQRRFGADGFPTLVVTWLDGSAPAVLHGYRGRDWVVNRLLAAGRAPEPRAVDADAGGGGGGGAR